MSAALKNSPRMMAVFERIADERLRQQRLLAEGRFKYSAASPVVNHDFRLRVLVEEIGEVAQAIDRLTSALGEQARRDSREHLREELVQVAAVTVAWLETMEASVTLDPVGGGRQ